uniref:Uncharacterized protein n=1 Tax=Arundo donax TaxID=35708 RepID=A0A0A9F9A8_ARUDO
MSQFGKIISVGSWVEHMGLSSFIPGSHRRHLSITSWPCYCFLS